MIKHEFGRIAGMNKMVINHLEKLIVTGDASTIISELEVEHPAAKLLALAARAQEQEIGDGTNLVIFTNLEASCRNEFFVFYSEMRPSLAASRLRA